MKNAFKITNYNSRLKPRRLAGLPALRIESVVSRTRAPLRRSRENITVYRNDDDRSFSSCYCRFVGGRKSII